SGRLVIDRPEAHDHCSRTGDLERASQSEDSLTCPNRTEPRVACRENNPFGTLKVEADDFFGSEDRIADSSSRRTVGAGECQSGKQERILVYFVGLRLRADEAPDRPCVTPRPVAGGVKKKPMRRQMNNSAPLDHADHGCLCRLRSTQDHCI